MKRLEAIEEKIKRLEADKAKFLAKADDLTSLEDLEKCVKELDTAKKIKWLIEVDLGVYKIQDPPEPSQVAIEKPEEVKPVAIVEKPVEVVKQKQGTEFIIPLNEKGEMDITKIYQKQ